MRKPLSVLAGLLATACLYISCSKSNNNPPADPCAGVTVTVSGSVTDAAAGQANGALSVTATGGSGFTYSLNGGAYQSSGTFSSLAAGNYTITAKNSDGCTGSKSFTIGTINPCTGVTVTVTGTVTNATGTQANGAITVNATGGTGFTYSLNGGAFQAGNTFPNLAAGTYTITAKNSNGCTGSQQFTVVATNPCTGVTITVTGTVTNATAGAANGSITATATGGTGFTYSLNGGAFQASGSFNNLAAGTYTVVAQTGAGCTGSQQFTVGTTNPCAGVTITINTNVTTATPCGGTPGSITVNATGSTGFTYSLNGGAFQSSNIFSNLATGNYSISVKDLNGCSQTGNATVSTTPPGTLFSAVRTIVQNNCAVSGCHTATGLAGGINFQIDCNIISNKDRIKLRAVDQAGTASQMPQPPNPALSTTERQAIVNWINAGGNWNN